MIRLLSLLLFIPMTILAQAPDYNVYFGGRAFEPEQSVHEIVEEYIDLKDRNFRADALRVLDRGLESYPDNVYLRLQKLDHLEEYYSDERDAIELEYWMLIELFSAMPEYRAMVEPTAYGLSNIIEEKAIRDSRKGQDNDSARNYILCSLLRDGEGNYTEIYTNVASALRTGGAIPADFAPRLNRAIYQSVFGLVNGEFTQDDDPEVPNVPKVLAGIYYTQGERFDTYMKQGELEDWREQAETYFDYLTTIFHHRVETFGMIPSDSLFKELWQTVRHMRALSSDASIKQAENGGFNARPNLVISQAEFQSRLATGFTNELSDTIYLFEGFSTVRDDFFLLYLYHEKAKMMIEDREFQTRLKNFMNRIASQISIPLLREDVSNLKEYESEVEDALRMLTTINIHTPQLLMTPEISDFFSDLSLLAIQERAAMLSFEKSYSFVTKSQNDYGELYMESIQEFGQDNASEKWEDEYERLIDLLNTRSQSGRPGSRFREAPAMNFTGEANQPRVQVLRRSVTQREQEATGASEPLFE